jgi:hypothetical protein
MTGSRRGLAAAGTLFLRGIFMTREERRHALEARAADYLDIALTNIEQEFPHHLATVVTGPDNPPAWRPRELHPVFYGSFDWHSCVEMYWLLIRLPRLLPGLMTETVIGALDRHLTPEAVAGEIRYLTAHPGFERPYGYGWLLALGAEAAMAPGAEHWASRLEPLMAHARSTLAAWLSSAPLPHRSGLHSNSAFALLLALPAARQAAADGDPLLKDAIESAARRWFLADRGYDLAWEPSGSDFLSQGLVEATLMEAVLTPAEFTPWLQGFLPRLVDQDPAGLPVPVEVPDVSDGQVGHLVGLNLSRAWCLVRIARGLTDDRLRIRLERRADEHASLALGREREGYMLSHWLVAYAVLYLSDWPLDLA